MLQGNQENQNNEDGQSPSENKSTTQKKHSRSAKTKRNKTASIVRLRGPIDNIKAAPNATTADDGIAAQVTIAPDGGWGWVVLFCSFFSLALTDGTIFTFAPLLPLIRDEFQIAESLAAAINSVLIAVCFISCPVSSALINRFGFRAVAMTGTIISSVALFVAYFSTGFSMLLFFYGIVNGIGCSMIIISSSLVVGFYFERLRSIVMPIVSTGAPIGTMALYPVNCELVALGGWRNTMLINSGIIGFIFFIAMTYRPLPTLTVTEEPLEAKKESSTTKLSRGQSLIASNPGLTKAVSNVNFPTAAEFFKDSTTAQNDRPSTTKRTASRIMFRTYSTINNDNFKKIMSLASSVSLSKNKTELPLTILEESTDSYTSVQIQVEVIQQPEKSGCFEKWCQWPKHPKEARPMYRDDVFYEGKIQSLPAYQRSIMAIDEKDRTGLEYQMEVSRSCTVHDLNEEKGVFTTALRRVFATIFDPRLLKQRSFLLFCFSGLFSNAGLLVPYIFIQARGLAMGLNPSHAMMLVSVISISNVVGRLTAVVLALKIKTQNIFVAGLGIAGVATLLSGLSNTSVYQFGYCCIFGFCMAHSSLRSVSLVELYGLENLTSSTGLALMFNGLGNLFSSPLASVLRNTYGYDAAFYLSGSFITFSGFVFFLVRF